MLSNGENCTVLRAAVLTQYRRVTDGRTDGRTDRRNCCSYYSACNASIARAVKTLPRPKSISAGLRPGPGFAADPNKEEPYSALPDSRLVDRGPAGLEASPLPKKPTPPRSFEPCCLHPQKDPASTLHIRPLQNVLNAVVRLILCKGKYDRITAATRDSLHWLPV